MSCPRSRPNGVHACTVEQSEQEEEGVVERLKVPDRNEEYLLYQTLIGAWPLGEPGADEYEVFRTRIREYMLKAAREAKVNTSWINPECDL